jgi:hypothetical protein
MRNHEILLDILTGRRTGFALLYVRFFVWLFATGAGLL